MVMIPGAHRTTGALGMPRARCHVHRARQPVDAGSAGDEGQVDMGEEGVEAVATAGPDMQFGLSTCHPDPVGVVDDLVAEHLGGTGVEIGRG